MSTMNNFAPFRKKYGCFIVRNICSDRKKVISIFKYPILWNDTRDLLKIEGVSESDIRASLLKGELRHKILAKDIVIECSDIDLLQFNDDQKLFLQNAGVVKGLEVEGVASIIPFLLKQNVPMIGIINGINRIFSIPIPDKFINGSFHGNIFKIQVFHNGRELDETIDYIVSESGGVGTGYDTIILISFSPRANSKMYCNYVIRNPIV
jgi:hypothetical protein